MPRASHIQTSFNAGEISPHLEGRVDLDRYAHSCATMVNFLPTVEGPAEKRPGTRFVANVYDNSDVTRLIPFQFSRTQAYVLEFGDRVMRVYKNGGIVLTSFGESLNNITAASPAVVTTATNHDFISGQSVQFAGVAGTMGDRLNGRVLPVTVLSATTFSVPVDLTGLVYSAAADTVVLVFDLVTPYPSSALSQLTFAQSADVLYLAHPDYYPRKLLRFDHDEWVIAEARGYDLGRSFAVAGITNANPAVVSIGTSDGKHGFAAGDRVFLSRIPGMGEVSGRVFTAANPTTTSIELSGEDSTNYRHVHDPTGLAQEVIADAWPPFSPENTRETLKIVASAEDKGATVTLVATEAIFTSSHVGAALQLRIVPEELYPKWEPRTNFNDTVVDDLTSGGAIAVGDFCHYEGNVYELIAKTTGGVTGYSPPIHTGEGEQQLDHKWTWEFAHDGKGFVEITSYVSGYRVEGTIRRRLPQAVVDTNGVKAITGTTAANPVVVTAVAHGFSNGDTIFIWGVSTADELNGRSFTAAGVTANTFQLTGEDGTTYGAGTGGFAVRIDNASFRWSHGAWSEVNGYPRTVAFFEDRLWWAGTDNEPQTFWGSEVGLYESHAVTRELDSAYSSALNAQEMNAIEWIHARRALVAGTAGGEFLCTGTNPDEAISAENILKALRMTSHGVKEAVLPIQSETALLFVQRAGRKLREFVYDIYNSDEYRAPDVSLLASHVPAPGIKEMALQKEPQPHLWCVMEDGSLGALTYDRTQDVVGWSRHTLGGVFGSGSAVVESVCSIPHPDGDQDQVWLVVRRTVNGATVRHVEYFEKPWRDGNAIEDAYFLDSMLTYDGSAATTISGLWHLIGQTVQALADGVYAGTFTVSATGTITLSASASVVQVGLPMGGAATAGAVLQTNRLEFGGADGPSQGKMRSIGSIVLRLFQTGAGLKYGPSDDFANMDALTMKLGQDPSGAAVSLLDGDTNVLPMPGDDDRAGRVCVKHYQPLPCTVVAIMPRAQVEEP